MRWLVAIEGALLTHPLLDAFTVYGTQLFWPFPGSPIMWSSIFIIDPLYTLPLLVGCVAAWFLREKRASDTWLRAALILSTGYLGWSLVAKAMVEREIARAGLAEHPHFTTPTPFNTLLWRVVVMTPDGYLEGERSLVADTGPLRLTPHGTNTKALAEVEDFPAVKRLRWFTRGFMKAEEENGLLVVSDLRLGATPHFPFRYVVAEREGSQLRQVPARWAQREFELGSMLDGLWDRIWQGSAVPSSEVSAP